MKNYTNIFEEPMTPKQVSEQFFHNKISYGVVLQMAKSGKMPFHRIGRKFFIWPNELLAWQAGKAGEDLDRDCPEEKRS